MLSKCKKTMFHNKNLLNKFIFKFGPITTILIVVTILIAVIYFSIQWYRQMQTNQNDLSKFTELIYEYVLGETPFNDETITYINNSFKKNSIMLEDFKDWASDTGIFGEFCGVMRKILVATTKKNSVHYRSVKIWEIVEFFIRNVFVKLPTKPLHQRYPFGSNWYQFAIDFPLLLVVAAFLYRRVYGKANSSIERYMSIYVSSYLKNPSTYGGVSSIGYTRYGPNTLMMGVPYIGAHLLSKTLNKNDNVCRYIKEVSHLQYVNSGEGIFKDGSFVFHTVLRANGYLYGSFKDIKIISQFFDIGSHGRVLRIYQLHEHPTIQIRHTPWFTRDGNRKSKEFRHGTLGFCVLNHWRAIIAKTENWKFAFNGQCNHLCWYEADRTNFNWGQIWLMARPFYYKNSEEEWFKDYVPYYPGVISYDNQINEVKVIITDPVKEKNKTTQTFMPQLGECTICILDNGAIGVRNNYIIKEGDVDLAVTETVLVTQLGHHSYYNIKPNVQANASRPIRLSVNFGQYMHEDSSLGGIGKPYKFKENNSFVYDNGGKTEVIDVKNPINDEVRHCLQIKPILSNTLEGSTAKLGYSTIHAEVNELTDLPTIDMIKSIRYMLQWDDDKLWLYDKQTKQVAISEEAGSITHDTFIISADKLDKKFGRGKFSISGAANFDKTFSVKTTDNYQMVINLIEVPEL